MSLKNEIQEVISGIRCSFHMPGHKYKGVLNYQISETDTTELPGTDNLHAAFSCIKNAEDYISGLYGSKRSRIMVSGSSMGLIAAIYALSERGDRVLIGRDSHKSIFHACRIAGLRYACAMPRLSGCALPLDYENLHETLMRHPEIRLAVLTSPTYYGHLRDLSRVARELGKRGGYLIVDEAHGAHLAFMPLARHSALAQGAHIVVQSAHKSLPAMTMAAMLHYGREIDEAAIARVDEALRMFQSSSPSYPIMISVEEACRYMDANRETVSARYSQFKDFEASSPFLEPAPCDVPKDPFKLFLNSAKIGYTGFEVAELLRSRGIYPEFAQYSGVLLYLSALNTPEELSELAELVGTLQARPPLAFRAPVFPALSAFSNSAGNWQANCEIIDVKESLGRVMAEDIIPYPPGIPLALKGEKIEEELFQALMEATKLPALMIEGREEGLRSLKVEVREV